jgi:hypothetical protein
VLLGTSEFDIARIEGGDVATHDTGIRRARPASRPKISPARLDALIEEAIVDAYNESEQAVGFHATIDEHLALPFDTVVLGITVTVKKIDVSTGGEIVAVCSRGRERQAVPILDLPLPDPPPAGWEWIEAYRRWSRGRG